MQLYHGMSVEFISDTVQNRITAKLQQTFEQQFQYQAPQSEVRSWQNSLRAMSSALQLGGFTDHGVVLEWQLPLSSKRLDCMVTGQDHEQRANAVIVELKQWEETERSYVDDCVVTFVGGRLRDQLHPSKQVGNYQRYLLDVHTVFSSALVGLQACSYLHNLVFAESAELFDQRHGHLLAANPLFAGDQVDGLAGLLDPNVGSGQGGPILDHVLTGGYRPHKRLLDHTARVIRHEPAYVLLDEQQVVFNKILARVRARQLGSTPTVFLVKGGPGTGKSVLAVNLVAELSAQGYVTHHATGSKAFTENLRRTVGTRAAAQFGYFNSYGNAEPGQLDVLVLDEAHRIRASSANRFTPADRRPNRAQIEELIRAAKTSVFFIDDIQVVRPGEVGSSELIRSTATALGCDLVETEELEAQFRCNGSDRYVRWVDTTLDLRRTTQVLWDDDDPFVFDVVDSPNELEALIRSRAAEGHTARLSAGFCWPWSNPLPDGTLVDDVVVGDWRMPWNAKPEAGRLAAGIPKSNYWASDPGGIEQVGCVYTAQGFEYDWAGVIWGRDLVYRPRTGWVGQPEYSRDSVVRRERDPARFTTLVKQTYRVLLTRGLQGCAIYFQDPQTRDFVLSRIAAGSPSRD
ncbi:MAG TPA: DUF2075 domain-containing protein [Acidimicrobiales bacterium]